MEKWKGLKKELENAKKKRNISGKAIIRECDCSKAHFYKVISGERGAGKDLIKELSKSLGISEDYIKTLMSTPLTPSKENIKPLKFSKDNKIYGVIIFCFTLFVIGYILYRYEFSENESNNISIIPIKKEPKIRGDSTFFIKDVTIPDGSYIFINTSFKKIWRLKNSGTVPWKNRYLMRITPFSDVNCKSDTIVPIKDTPIGEEVDIEVNFISMNLVGSCRTDWKMVDEYKNAFFPNKHSLYSEVHVTNNKALINKKSP